MSQTRRYPKVAQIKVPYTSPASITTQKKTQTTRITEEIKLLYKKKDKLNEILHKTHLQAAWEWGKSWDPIHTSIHNTINRKSERKYRLLENKITRIKETQEEKVDNNYKFYPRIINQTDIKFTNRELMLLNKGLKYNLGHKYKNRIRDLGLEAECAITLLPPQEQ